MRSDYEHIVVGLGGLGSATAYWLARRAGSDVLGLERFEIGHDRGASQDHSRIVRLSYHSPGYVALAKHAYAAWAELEESSATSLIVRTGGLDLWPQGAESEMGDYTESLKACGVSYEVLDAAEIMARWPQWRLEEGVRGLFQEAGGIAAAARCNAAHVAGARAHGATLLEGTPVTTIRGLEGEVEIRAGERAFRARDVLVCADAWTNEMLASQGFSFPLTVTQEQVTYFATPRRGDFAPERFPIWIWMGEPSFYGFPVFVEAGVKAGQDVGGEEVTTETRTFEPDRAALRRVTDFLAQRLPTALGPVIYTKTCLYTMPPDRDFIIGAVPHQPEVLVAQGAAHGFKFASLIGKIMSELALDGATSHDISAFGLGRASLVSET